MYTYIIKSQDLYKIGKAQNVDKRVASFMTGNPSFSLIKTIKGDFESFLHEHFKSKKFHLEWYKLDQSDIDSMERIIENRYNADKVIHSIVTSQGISDDEKKRIDNVRFVMTESELSVLMKVVEKRIWQQSTILSEKIDGKRYEEFVKKNRQPPPPNS